MSTTYALSARGEAERHNGLTLLSGHELEILVRIDSMEPLASVQASMRHLSAAAFQAAVRHLLERSLLRVVPAAAGSWSRGGVAGGVPAQ
jgi:hypothetical protein